MKYILVIGGVISGIGKGLIASSVGTLLKYCGQQVTTVKIDPHINIDAENFSPSEHGEVFVLDDGGQVNFDLGNYERLLDVTLHSDNIITTGKIYHQVMQRERRGDFLGKTVRVVPHITDAIQEWVQRIAEIPITSDSKEPEVCIIELGGTIGDIEVMPFVEAFRQFQCRVGQNNFCCVHIILIPEDLTTCGEQKTKPTQTSVRTLRGLGLSPDLIICRSEKPITDLVKTKVSNFCHIPKEHVIGIQQCCCTYRIPLLLQDQNLVEFFTLRLQLNIPLPQPVTSLQKWKDLADKHDTVSTEISIALVGKYTDRKDAYTSVINALNHAALSYNYRVRVKYIEASYLEKKTEVEDRVKYHATWLQLCTSEGLIIPGGHGAQNGEGVDGEILAIEWARTMKVPFLGVCFGMQCAVIEFARNVLQWPNANSSEVDPNGTRLVVIENLERHSGVLEKTMILGKKQIIFNSQESILKKLYGNVEFVEERHRHSYIVDPQLITEFEAAGMKFVGRDAQGLGMKIMELETNDHPYFVAVQYQPEFNSRPLKPSPPYIGLIQAILMTLGIVCRQ